MNGCSDASELFQVLRILYGAFDDHVTQTDLFKLEHARADRRARDARSSPFRALTLARPRFPPRRSDRTLW